MSPKVTDVRHVGDYRLELSFSDGLKRVVDFRQRVLGRGGIWVTLHDIGYFKRVRVDAELDTIVWPNGVDICPDVLYALAAGDPVESAQPILQTVKQ